MTPTRPIIVHATAVAIDGVGVLLRGKSGSGKSDLALRLIEDGAKLVADDLVTVARLGRSLELRAPAAPARLRGAIEARGLGIVAVESVPRAPLALVLELVAPDRVERMPRKARCAYLGLRVPRLDLAPFEASAALKVRLAVRALKRENDRR